MFFAAASNQDFDLKSMGACIRRININWDDKNRKNERRFLGALDGHGIYRHNEVPFKRDLHLVPGYNLQDRHEARVSTSKINLIVEVRPLIRLIQSFSSIKIKILSR